MKKSKKPMSIILTDTHLEDDNEEANLRVYREARGLAKEANLNYVLHGGDIFKARKAQTQRTLTTFDQILFGFDNDKIDLEAIPGNHDKTNYAIVNSFLDSFRYHPHFSLHRIPYERVVHSSERISLTMAPFFADTEYIKSFDEKTGFIASEQFKRVMLTHIGMDQAMMNNGMKVTSLIKEDLFKDYNLVLIGHYHDASDYSSKIKYIGSSIQHNYGERTDKGITVLYDDLSIETIDPGTPKFFTYVVPVENLTNKYLADIKKQKEESQDGIKVIITGEEVKIKAFDKQRLQVAGIKVATKEEKIIAEDLEERVEAFTDQSLLTAFEDFCEKNNLEKETGIKYLNSILKPCTSPTT